MTPAQIRTHRAKLQLTQAGAASLLGVGWRTWAGWEAEGESSRQMPEPAQRLLRLAVAMPRVRAWLENEGPKQ